MDTIISTPAFNFLVKHLQSSDIPSVRAVSRKWRSTFQEQFEKILPITLKEEDLPEFSSKKNRLIKTERFTFDHNLSAYNTAVLVNRTCKLYSRQIKSLGFTLSRSNNERVYLTAIIKSLSETLEILKIQHEPEGILSLLENPVFSPMPRLKKLELSTKKKPTTFMENSIEEDWTHNVLNCFPNFILNCIPNLEVLNILGFTSLQKTVFKKLREDQEKLQKLRVLRMEDVLLSVVKDLADSCIVENLTSLELIVPHPETQYSEDGEELPNADQDLTQLLDSLSKLIRKVRKNVVKLDLRLRLTPDLHIPNDNNTKLVIPVAPELKCLTLGIFCNNPLSVEFEMRSKEGFPIYSKMFPKLKELRIIEEDMPNISRSMFSQDIDLQHQRVDTVTIERKPEKKETLKETEESLRMILSSQFPNAVISFVCNSD